MLKLWNKRVLLHSLRELPFSGKSSFTKASNDFIFLRGLSTQSGSMTATASTGDSAAKIYAPFSIFRGKAALAAEPMLPKFVKLESGASFKVERSGGVLLTFRPAIGERKYDSEKSQKFALSATEVGSVISLGPNGSCEFFHDPSMKTGNAGQINKKLSIRAHADGSGYMFSLNVVDNILKKTDRITVPITTAEYEVLRTAFSYVLPNIMGWNQYTNPQLPRCSNQNLPKPAGELEGTEWE